MQCHRCRHNAAVQAGQFKGMAFEDTPCAKCRLRHDSSHVLPFKGEIVAGEIGTACQDNEGKYPAWVMAEFVRGMLELTPEMRDAVCLRGMGLSLAEIATQQEVSVKVVDKRLRRAVERWPVVGALFARRAVRSAQRQRGKQGKTGALGAEAMRKAAVSGGIGNDAVGDAANANV